MAKEKPKKKGGRPKNCGACRKSKNKCNCGRPSKLNKATIDKLEEAFAMGCPDVEACLHAGISMSTLQNWQKDNPGLLARKKALKQTPFLKARRTINRYLDKPNMAQWFMEKRKRDEFYNKTENVTKYSDKQKRSIAERLLRRGSREDD